MIARLIGFALAAWLMAAPQLQTRFVSPAPATLNVTIEHVILAGDRLQAGRWFPDYPPNPVDIQIIANGLGSRSAGIRAAAVRAIGRLEDPRDVPQLAVFLNDTDAGVREEAVSAIAQALWTSKGEDVKVSTVIERAALPVLATTPDGRPLPNAANSTSPRTVPAAGNIAALKTLTNRVLGEFHYDPATASHIEKLLMGIS